ncbi:MAG: 3-dehydroquinate synthase [Lachnospiraceae bacterium]
MVTRLPITVNKKPSYDIVYSHGFEELTSELETLEMQGKQVCIVTDTNVAPLFANTIQTILDKLNCRSIVFTFPSGEESKNLITVQEIYKVLIEEKFTRQDILIALGGGVVGDITGYTAATYLRGIDFIQIPTTLLAQVDSSIGGKTGVDFDRYKNMVGAFHMPRLVYTNLETLLPLPDRQFYSGMGEVMKAGLIRDAVFYEWLITNLYEIGERQLDTLTEMVMRSNQIKKMIVEKDPLEQGDRALLNLGHTIGHAIEKAKDFTLLHGECVALGCVGAAYISKQHQLLSSDEYYEIRDMFVPFNLPITIEDIDPQEIVSLTKSDKKMEAGHLKFILLKKIGRAVIDKTVTEEDILEAVKELHYSEEDKYE